MLPYSVHILTGSLLGALSLNVSERVTHDALNLSSLSFKTMKGILQLGNWQYALNFVIIPKEDRIVPQAKYSANTPLSMNHCAMLIRFRMLGVS